MLRETYHAAGGGVDAADGLARGSLAVVTGASRQRNGE